MPVNPETRIKMMTAYGKKCFYCHKVLRGNEITTDHLIPVAYGGTNDVENLVPSCKPCNQDKGHFQLDEYIAVLEIRRDRFIKKVKKVNEALKRMKKLNAENSALQG